MAEGLLINAHALWQFNLQIQAWNIWFTVLFKEKNTLVLGKNPQPCRNLELIDGGTRYSAFVTFYFCLLLQMKWSTSQPPRSSPLRKLGSCVRSEAGSWLPWGTSTWPGGTALTSVTTGGWRTAASGTRPPWRGPSAAGVYLGWEPCIAMRTKQASLTPIASLMPTAMNVSIYYFSFLGDDLQHACREKRFLYRAFCFGSCSACGFLEMKTFLSYIVNVLK